LLKDCQCWCGLEALFHSRRLYSLILFLSLSLSLDLSLLLCKSRNLCVCVILRDHGKVCVWVSVCVCVCVCESSYQCAELISMYRNNSTAQCGTTGAAVMRPISVQFTGPVPEDVTKQDWYQR